MGQKIVNKIKSADVSGTIHAPTGKELTKGQMIVKKVLSIPKRIGTSTGYMVRGAARKVLDKEIKFREGVQSKTKKEFLNK